MLLQEKLRSSKLNKIATEAYSITAKSYVKRVREYAKKGKGKVLPPDMKAISACAVMILKSLLTGIDHAVAKNDFADDELDIDTLSFTEAVEYLSEKVPMEKDEYYKLSNKARFRAFTVSRVADGDMVGKVKTMLAKNLAEGGSLADFLKQTDEQIAKGLGLAGNGGGYYWENVYRTNVQTAYNAGRAMGFETVKPIALELVGIGDMRQTEICRELTQPPVRLAYDNPFWQSHWPPFHFGCRTTIRAIYDEAEIEEEPLSEKVKVKSDVATGFGEYPIEHGEGEGGTWWRELDSQVRRARAYGVQGEIRTARELLVVKILEKDIKVFTEKDITINIDGEIKKIKTEFPHEKLTSFYLNEQKTPDKAKTFKNALGYDLDNYKLLIDNMYSVIENFSMTKSKENKHGEIFSADINLTGQNGKNARVMTGWIKEFNQDIFRLTAIYVKEKKKK